jgi:hypothetical protein
MNSVASLKYRLLRLFPVAVVKSQLNPEGKTQGEMLTELQAQSDAVLVQFAFDNFGSTKQHVFLFEHDGTLNALNNQTLLDHGLVACHQTPGKITYTYLFKHHYDVKAVHTETGYEVLDVVFRQPILITITPDHVSVALTILEKSLKGYLQDYEVLYAKRRLEDQDVIEMVKNGFMDSVGVTLDPLDLNSGIKALWTANTIDSTSLKYKRASSVASVIMDEEFLFRQENPAEWLQVMNSPLKKTVFRYVVPSDDLCNFECDPGAGSISFNVYPKTINQIDNVVSQIIAAN